MFGFVKILEYIIRCIVFIIDLVNPLNAIDLVFKLLYTKSGVGRLKGHQGTVVSFVIEKGNAAVLGF
jgi:hypothetical protein